MGGVIGMWFSSHCGFGSWDFSASLDIFLLLLLLQLFELNQMVGQAAVAMPMPCVPGGPTVVQGTQSKRKLLFWRWRTAASHAVRNNNGIICVCCGLMAF